MYLGRCSVAASLTILYYDWLLTLPEEIQLYWRHQWSITSLFYLLNRYCTLLVHIPVAIEFYVDVPRETYVDFSVSPVPHRTNDNHVTSQLPTSRSIPSIVQRSADKRLALVLLTIRTYALYGRSQAILRFLIAWIAITFSVGVWALVVGQRLPGSPPDLIITPWSNSCLTGFSVDQTHYLAVAWAIAMAFDVIIFILTLYKRLQVGRTLHNSLFTLMELFTSGTISVGTVVIRAHEPFVCLSLVQKYRAIIDVTTLTNVIGATLMSRLMLNIRDPKNIGIYTEEWTGTIPTFLHESISLSETNSSSARTYA
ncbi:hypothetical protein K474DRAFT_1712537 [Panus rudis PR-1116 ss-1]|nr:hypothetical protein K474DRAFT_1712537 [Panus rudis PR-1116 ss-1]